LVRAWQRLLPLTLTLPLLLLLLLPLLPVDLRRSAQLPCVEHLAPPPGRAEASSFAAAMPAPAPLARARHQVIRLAPFPAGPRR
jgi:hypothetical protein